MVCANECVAFPMGHFDIRRPITQGKPMSNLAPSVPLAGVVLSLLLLATKVLPQLAASSFVRVNMLVKCLMDNAKSPETIRLGWRNLFVASLLFKQAGGLLSHRGRQCGFAPAFLRSLCRCCAGLLWQVIFMAPIASKIPTDGRFVSIKQLGDLSLIVSGFPKGIDLIPFNLAEIFLVHGQLRLASNKP